MAFLGLSLGKKKELPEIIASDKTSIPSPAQQVAPSVQNLEVKAAPYQINEVAVKPAEQQTINYSYEPQKPSGYFAAVYEQLAREEELITNLDSSQRQDFLSRDLLHEMKNYWEGREPLLASKDIDAGLKKKAEELAGLESEWQQLEDQLEKTRLLITEKEVEIESKISELKGAINATKLRQRVNINESFKLKDGRLLRSLEELSLILKTMDESTFGFHVSEQKNDFASWVRTALDDEELALKLEQEHSAQAMASAIGSYFNQ